MSPEARPRSGPQTSWLTGLVLGVAGAVLLLEFPIVGIAIDVVVVLLIWRRGSLLAGIGGLLTGLGGTWLFLFGRVALTCGAATGDESCFAPDISSAVVTSAIILAIGGFASVVAAVRSRRG